MDHKLFRIVIDGVPVANMPVYSGNTIGQLKTHIANMYPNTTLTIYANEHNTINIDNEHNNLPISTYWNHITNGMIVLLSITPQIPGPNTTAGPNIRIRNVARGVSYPSVKNFTNIPAWSRGASPWKQLSPFIIGPVVFEENNQVKQATIFENFWQGFKVWKAVDKQKTKNWNWPAETHVDIIDNPNNNWYKWHDSLLKHTLPVRRPNGKKVPLYAWWKGRKLGVIESRKEIYVPYLQQLYRNHPVYQKLLNEVRTGKNIIILEPDGPRHELYPDGMSVSLELLYGLQNVTKMKDFPGGDRFGDPNKYVPYGHGYVLALTLLEDLK